MEKKIFDKNLLTELYIISGMSIVSMAKVLGTTQITLRRRMVENDIKINSKLKFSNKPIQLSALQEEILIGGLLGDACLTQNGKKETNAQLIYLSSVKSHVIYFKSFFDTTSKDVSVNHYFDKRTNKTYTRYSFRTQLNSTFTKYRDKWYPKGVKIIPTDIKLTPNVCLIWYLGDGSIQNDLKEKRTEVIKLSTNGFSVDDIKTTLLPQLKVFEPTIYYNDGKPIIIIPRKNIRLFLSYIGDCPIPEYSYKWLVFDYKYKKYKEHEK